MKHFSVMIKPASSACNLRCRYCFYEDEASSRSTTSYGIMQKDIMEAVIDNVFAGLTGKDEVTFAFQGGEPTVAGIGFFRDFADYVDRKKSTNRHVAVSYVIQTNATLLDDDWCAFFKERNFLVGVSLDLHRGCHDSVRVDANGDGTFDTVLKGIDLLKHHGVSYNILSTLTEELAGYPRKVWDFIVKNDYEYVQFTPCMDGLEGKNGYGLRPESFASFYRDIFDRWYDDFTAGRGRSIKLFDDIANLLLFGKRTACGIDGHCTPQIIVGADGSVYPCDFYCLDEYKIGNLASENILDLYEKARISPAGAPAPAQMCKGCRYERFCGGGCKRMRSNVCFVNDSGDYCGYRDLLDFAIPKLRRL
ncbi:MAG: radical SAM protein [Butyrivibrio sp.]|nr:radical SAM protein [Butyrivibrio sp.]